MLNCPTSTRKHTMSDINNWKLVWHLAQGWDPYFLMLSVVCICHFMLLPVISL